MKSKKKFYKSVIFATTVKNAENYISNFIKIVSNLSKIYKDYYIIIVESDSTDNTISKIKKITKNYKCELCCLNTKKIKFRTSRLSIARNKILGIIKKNKKLNKFDDLILLDSDNVNKLITPLLNSAGRKIVFLTDKGKVISFGKLHGDLFKPDKVLI